MSRVVAFGCSITYGTGLSEPNAYAWPECLGKMLEKEVVNNGQPGASNFQILHNILNFDFCENDQVFIMWSYIDRDMVFTDNGIRTLGVWQTDELARCWLTLNHPTDRAIKSWYNIHYANLFLSSRGIDVYNYIVHLSPLEQHKPSWFDITIHDIDVQAIKTIDLAEDKMHPGPLAHKEIAARIGKTLNEY